MPRVFLLSSRPASHPSLPCRVRCCPFAIEAQPPTRQRGAGEACSPAPPLRQCHLRAKQPMSEEAHRWCASSDIGSERASSRQSHTTAHTCITGGWSFNRLSACRRRLPRIAAAAPLARAPILIWLSCRESWRSRLLIPEKSDVVWAQSARENVDDLRLEAVRLLVLELALRATVAAAGIHEPRGAMVWELGTAAGLASFPVVS